ncbi:MAG: DinB family protein [Acidobacteriaceae bacterium]|nr:DinB family protein [Acidobacteriaceae bacterium]MBV9781657.1 DinB family protein [Acidobacteriaceae bacterium]
MTTAELLLQDFDSEMSNTRRTLERVPEDKPDYKPHKKSMPMGRLAMHCATLPLFGQYLIEDEGMDIAAPKHPHPDLSFKSREECLKQFDESAAKCRAALAAATDAQLAAPWRFSWGEQLISNDSRSLSYRRMFLNHLIHHVAQLGVYFRFNDVPVPALYGPSADEQWSPK